MTTAAALFHRGKEITLLDGRTAIVMFDLEALAQIEEDFGSLGGWQDTLNEIKDKQLNAQMMRPLLKMLRAGLLHNPAMANANFDPQRLEEYFGSVMGAAELAFPQQAQGSAGQTPTNGIADSPGTSSTTSAPLSSVAPMSASGA